MSSERFAIIYEEAYNQAHHNGHDAVAEQFETLSMFVDEILKTAE